MNRLHALALLLSLSACTMSPQDFPMPSALPDGGRGYAMTGYYRYSSSLPEAKVWVQKKMDEACSAPSRFVQYKADPVTNAFGVPFVKYDVVAECASKL